MVAQATFIPVPLPDPCCPPPFNKGYTILQFAARRQPRFPKDQEPRWTWQRLKHFFSGSMSRTTGKVRMAGKITCEYAWDLIPATDRSRWVNSWDQLNRRGARSPLTQSWFLLPALDHFGTGHETVAIGRNDKGDIVAMMLLNQPSHLRCNGFQPSQTPLASVLLAPGENIADAGRSLIRALPREVFVLTFLHLDERLIAMPPAARDLEVSPRFETGAIATGTHFPDYYEKIPRKARKNSERRIRKATAEVGAPQLTVWTTPDRIDEFLHLYSDSEVRGWKGAAGSAVRLDDAQGQFYRDLLYAAAERQALRMYLLSFGGRPAAQQIAIEWEGIVYLLKTTYDETLTPYAPGIIQRHFILEWSHAQQPPERDFETYGHITEATAPFMTSQRFIYHLSVLRHASLRLPLEILRRSRAFLIFSGGKITQNQNETRIGS